MFAVMQAWQKVCPQHRLRGSVRSFRQMGQVTSSFNFNRISESITICPDLRLLWLRDFCQIGETKGGRVRNVRINDAVQIPQTGQEHMLKDKYKNSRETKKGAW